MILHFWNVSSDVCVVFDIITFYCPLPRLSLDWNRSAAALLNDSKFISWQNTNLYHYFQVIFQLESDIDQL